MGLNFMGSYCVLSFAEERRNRRICGSVRVAHRAARKRRENIKMPPGKLASILNVAAPIHRAKKNSFRSTPRMVRGR